MSLSVSLIGTPSLAAVNIQERAAQFQLKDYSYSLATHLSSLERYQESINRYLKSSRWETVPENLLMVYLWNRENYHDDSFHQFADEWVELSEKAVKQFSLEEAHLASIFAYLIKQDFKNAEASFGKLKNKDSFLAHLAMALIGTTQRVTTTLQGNQNLNFRYTVRIADIEEAKETVSQYPDSPVARYTLATILERKSKELANNEERETVDYSPAIAELDKAIETDPYNLLYPLKKIELKYAEAPNAGESEF